MLKNQTFPKSFQRWKMSILTARASFRKFTFKKSYPKTSDKDLIFQVTSDEICFILSYVNNFLYLFMYLKE